MPITVNALVAHDTALDEQIRHTINHQEKLAGAILSLDEAERTIAASTETLTLATRAIGLMREHLAQSINGLDNAIATMDAVKSASAQDGSVVDDKTGENEDDQP